MKNIFMQQKLSHRTPSHTWENTFIWTFKNIPERVARVLQRINIEKNDLISGRDLYLFHGKKIDKKNINFNIEAFIPSKNRSSHIAGQNIQYSHCNFTWFHIESGNFMNSQFNNCTFDIRTFRNFSFVWAQFRNCRFDTSLFLECDFSHTLWRDNIYNSGIMDFLDCEMKSIDGAEISHSITIPDTHVQVDSHTSWRVSLCTDFEWAEGCWSDGNKKRVIWVYLNFWETFPMVPLLVFFARDSIENCTWKIAYMVDAEISFPTSWTSLCPGIFYSIPNAKWPINPLIRDRFLEIDLMTHSWEKNDYSQVQFWWSIDLSDLSDSSRELIIRPFRPASMGTPWFSEYISENFRKMRV